MPLALHLAALDHNLRPMLESVLLHKVFIKTYSRTRNWFLDMLSTSNPKVEAPQRPVRIHNLTFRNDLATAAGFDKDGKLLAFNYLKGAGYAIVGTVLDEENKGNLIRAFYRDVNPWVPLPRTRAAVNTLGLPSKGIDAAVRNIEEFRDKYDPKDFPIIISLMGHPKKHGRERITGLQRAFKKALQVADGIQVNHSCPNVEHSSKAREAREEISTLASIRDNYRTTFHVPIWVKLRDLGSNPEYTIQFYHEAGVDGLILTNTQINYSQLLPKIHRRDRVLFRHYTTKHKGGVSGPPIRDFSREQVETAAREIKRAGLDMLVSHVGGIETTKDMQRSRGISPKVALREWYTGEMTALATKSINKIYPDMVLGE